jgi:hypothetical protein
MHSRAIFVVAVAAAAALTATLVVSGPAAETKETTLIKVKGDELEFTCAKTVVARYHKGAKVAKPYLWPILGPGNVPMTRAWPMETGKGETMDHVHQKSAWFCHGDVIPEGMELTAGEKSGNKEVQGIDFWSEGKGHGVIVCTKVGEPQWEGREHSLVETTNEWRTAEGRKILDETRTLHLYGYGDARLFVFDIDLHASVCPITFGDTKEGSFGVRVSDAICEVVGKQKGSGKLENAEGKTAAKNVWGMQSAWCDYSGPIEGQTVGLAILTDPSNAHPSCWHSRDYGLMAANPFGRGTHAKFPAVKDKTDLVKLAKGEHLKLRYGILVHKGDAKEGNVADWYERFVKSRGQ